MSPCLRWENSMRADFETNVVSRHKLGSVTFAAMAVLICLSTTADAAQCGNGPAGFEAWKREFGAEASAKGIGASTVVALGQANYASATIAADRGQRSFGLSLDQ